MNRTMTDVGPTSWTFDVLVGGCSTGSVEVGCECVGSWMRSATVKSPLGRRCTAVVYSYCVAVMVLVSSLGLGYCNHHRFSTSPITSRSAAVHSDRDHRWPSQWASCLSNK